MAQRITFAALIALVALLPAGCSKNDAENRATTTPQANDAAVEASNAAEAPNLAEGDVESTSVAPLAPEASLRKPPVPPESAGAEEAGASPGTDGSSDAGATPSEPLSNSVPPLFRSLGRALGKGVQEAVTNRDEEPATQP